MGLLGFGGKKRDSAYDALVEGERMKAREMMFKEQAKVRGKQLAAKDADAARFAGLSRTERAKERFQKVRRFGKSVSGAVGAIGVKLNSAEQRFNQKAAAFGGQNQSVTGGQYDNLPAYLRPASAKEKRKGGGKTITIRVQ